MSIQVSHSLNFLEFRSSGVTDDSAEGSLCVSLQGLEVLSALELVRSACRELLSLDLWSLCLQRTPELHQLAKVEV